ncbi:unnamed protein product [Penicillium bialowiezense]
MLAGQQVEYFCRHHRFDSPFSLLFVDVENDHESLQYLATTRVYSKRLARWVDEFEDKNLKWKYRPGSEAIIPDTLSRRPDFVENTPANLAQNHPGWAQLSLMTKVGGFPEAEWYAATVSFLREGTVPTDPKTQLHCCHAPKMLRRL